MIDKDKLNKAFRLMRKAGLVARQDFSCCGGCGGYEIASDVSAMPVSKRAKVKGACFYHRQAADRMRNDEDLYLGFGSVDTEAHGEIGLPTVQVGLLVVSCLEQAGLTVEWDSDPSRLILVRS